MPSYRSGKEVQRTPHVAQPEELHCGMSFSDYRKSKMEVLKEATGKKNTLCIEDYIKFTRSHTKEKSVKCIT